MSTDVADTAIVFPGTIVGEGCRILDYAEQTGQLHVVDAAA